MSHISLTFSCLRPIRLSAVPLGSFILHVLNKCVILPLMSLSLSYQGRYGGDVHVFVYGGDVHVFVYGEDVHVFVYGIDGHVFVYGFD